MSGHQINFHFDFPSPMQGIEIEDEPGPQIAASEPFPFQSLPGLDVDAGHGKVSQIDDVAVAAPNRLYNSLPVANPMAFNEHVESLNPDQKSVVAFLDSWFRRRRPHEILLISGGPGTGKTHVVVKTLSYLRVNVIKMAFPRKIARAIDGQTIHSLLRIDFRSQLPGSIEDVSQRMEKLENEMEREEYMAECEKVAKQLCETFTFRGPRYEIVVIDEVGMIPIWFLQSIVCYLQPALFVLMGDEHQLKPVRCRYNVFSVNPFEMITTKISLVQNNRFNRDYHELIQNLREYVTRDDEKNAIEFIRRWFPVRKRILETDLPFVHRVLAYKNETVDRYNDQFLKQLPGTRYRFLAYLDGQPILRNRLDLKEGCRVTLTATFRSGTESYFHEYKAEEDTIVLRNGILVARNGEDGQFPLMVSYAVTVHKFQGQTIDEEGIVFDFDECKDLNLIYTALSRVRNMSQIYAIIL